MSLRAALEEAFRDTLAGLDIERRVRVALAPLACGSARVRVVAAGKGAPRMLAAAHRLLGDRVHAALLVVPDGVDVAPAVRPRVEVLRAGHPFPDARSIHAARRAIELVRGRHDLTVALISGGTSALLALPLPGVALRDKASLVQQLLRVDASISEVNVVRRHASGIKGGRLARASAAERVVTLLESDVIAGASHDVGSGPTLADPSRIEHARAVLQRHGLPPPRLAETLAPWEPRARRLRVRVIARPEDLAGAVAAALCRRGFRARILPAATRPMPTFVAEYESLAASLGAGEALVRAAEPTVKMTGESGRGGRAGHLAASLRLPEGVAFLAGASDGVDGMSGAAGASVDEAFAVRLAADARASALERYDSARLHEDAGTRIVLDPTGVNLADVHILARAA